MAPPPSNSTRRTLVSWAAFAAVRVAARPYEFREAYVGVDFFSKFDFFSEGDPTHGATDYVDEATATAEGLATATPDNVYIGVDMSKKADWGHLRQSVRISSKTLYNEGLFIIDVEHMPTGCGTWPAFWMFGADKEHVWPAWGEYDIIETAHKWTTNGFTLHTRRGCDQSDIRAGVDFLEGWSPGADGSPANNCDINAKGQWGNQGCSQTGPEGSAGPGFNQQGGGTFAAEWDPTHEHIRTWFWRQGKVPADIVQRAPKPELWGKPASYFKLEPGKCSQRHFHNMRLVINIALCGDLGNPTFGEACPAESKKMSCDAFVADPNNMKEAFWSIRRLDVYQQQGHNGFQAAPPPAPAYAWHDVAIGGYAPAVLAGRHSSRSSVTGDVVTLKHKDELMLFNHFDKEWMPENFAQLKLLGRTFSFVVDLSKVGCACNVAIELTSMPAHKSDGSFSKGTENTRGEDFPYTCDSEQGGGQWCPEVDLMEANNHALQSSPHTCDSSGNGHYESCDRGGCAQNTRDSPNAYGPGDGFTINTMHLFEVKTEFITEGDDLTAMRTTLFQDGRHVELRHESCSAEYLKKLSDAMRNGMSLRLSYKGGDAGAMSWLDSPPCGTESCDGMAAGDAFISQITIGDVVETAETVVFSELPGEIVSLAAASPGAIEAGPLPPADRPAAGIATASPLTGAWTLSLTLFSLLALSAALRVVRCARERVSDDGSSQWMAVPLDADQASSSSDGEESSLMSIDEML